MSDNDKALEQRSALPSLQELTQDVGRAFKNDQFNLLLNQNPPQKWICRHPLAKTKTDDGKTVPASYIPIDKVEFLLTRIFQEWRHEVISYGPLFNSIAVHVRVHYRNPITGEWSFHDGLGAVDVQVQKGSSPADLAKINYGAIQKGLPAAESYALKDAAEKLGKLFGKDLNRRDAIAFSLTYSDPDESDEKESVDVVQTISDAQLDELNELIGGQDEKLYTLILDAYNISGLGELQSKDFNECKGRILNRKKVKAEKNGQQTELMA